ncbi:MULTISPECIES: ribonuclease HIII [unclassified Granulicatella]|uniref:ribonuclease HIII n=1 Tax=unclassified Granulicatella TaxID=2630493 RepID=UPI0010732D25|nr:MULTISPECIES: ribonuclease HIII [unclassified Granulicatella]MBF0780778.1 ribonuclease HIII [Granulicatella sp. 19428wC4_WM01]TFU93851.1 ribonuclease HIII [Granulicatella sp. WM01]
MHVITLPKSTLMSMKQHYTHYLKANPPAHSLFCAVYQGTTITAYTSGKVLFQGKQADQEAALWQEALQKNAQSTTSLPPHFHSLSVIGSDEVGTGSYFGSLVVCSAFVPSHQLEDLKKLGVQDSKKLTDTRIQQLAKLLKERIPYHIIDVLPEKYNDVQPTMSQGQMKAELHNHALIHLLKKIAPQKPDAILIDQFEQPSTYYRHIQHKPIQIKENVYFATKGESHHLAVAAASIIARATFLDTLNTLSQQAGCLLPSGANSTVDEVAAQLIHHYGIEVLHKFAKYHFANTQKAIHLETRL